MEKPMSDSILLSAIRGRVLAVLGASLSLWASAVPAWNAIQHLIAEGPTVEHIQSVVMTSTTSMDALQVLVIAGGSLIALIASGVSKIRSIIKNKNLLNELSTTTAE